MVMVEDNYDKVCWQQLLKKKTFAGPFAELVVSVLLVSWWSLKISQMCFGGRWCLDGTLVVCP
jgi:nucleoside recognition membrane protein YjiH